MKLSLLKFYYLFFLVTVIVSGNEITGFNKLTKNPTLRQYNYKRFYKKFSQTDTNTISLNMKTLISVDYFNTSNDSDYYNLTQKDSGSYYNSLISQDTSDTMIFNKTWTTSVNDNYITDYSIFFTDSIIYHTRNLSPFKKNLRREMWGKISINNNEMNCYIRSKLLVILDQDITIDESMYFVENIGLIYYKKIRSDLNSIDTIEFMLKKLNGKSINGADLALTVYSPETSKFNTINKQKFIKINSLASIYSLPNRQFEISIYASNGRRLASQCSASQIRVIQKTLPEGIYILKGNTNKKSFVFKHYQ